MRDYEITILTKSLVKNGGKKLGREYLGGLNYTVQEEGKKRLAYPMSGARFAYYTTFQVKDLPEDMPRVLSTIFSNDPKIIRYLIVTTN